MTSLPVARRSVGAPVLALAVLMLVLFALGSFWTAERATVTSPPLVCSAWNWANAPEVCVSAG